MNPFKGSADAGAKFDASSCSDTANDSESK